MIVFTYETYIISKFNGVILERIESGRSSRKLQICFFIPYAYGDHSAIFVCIQGLVNHRIHTEIAEIVTLVCTWGTHPCMHMGRIWVIPVCICRGPDNH